MPSPVPVKPSLSSVVAFTFTREAAIPTARAMFASICGMKSFSFGRWDHGHVDVAHPITRRSDLFRHVFQKQQGIRTLVLGVGVREMPPDISQPRRAQQGVGNGVEQHVGVGMAVQPLFVVDLHAAQYQVTAFHQPVHVVAMSDPHLVSSSRSSAIFRSRGVVTFRFRSSPSTIFTEKPIRSTAEQSSVSLALSAFALASAPRRISKSNT